VTIPEREAVTMLASYVTVNEPLFELDIGETVIHALSLVTIHGTLAVTDTLNDPEPFPTDCEAGLTVNEFAIVP